MSYSGDNKKERLDVILVDRGFFSSRERAKAFIMAGRVFVDGKKEEKSGTKFSKDIEITVKEDEIAYVSRGGLKLEKAVKLYNIDLSGKICMDIGASTGGFTDCMLKNGASRVYAVDVGTNQLAYKLRVDERVVSLEKTNIRYVKKEDIAEEMDFISIDVSFISLRLVLPVAVELLKDYGELVCLIKPQFEAGREKVGKKGVVRDYLVHKEIIKNIIDFLISLGIFIEAITYSPIKGPNGNIEYLLYAKKKASKSSKEELFDMADRLVVEAVEKLC